MLVVELISVDIQTRYPYATLHPAMSVRRLVGPSVPSLLFGVFELFEPTAPAQMLL